MKLLATCAVLATLVASPGAYAQPSPAVPTSDGTLRITRAGSQPSQHGPSEHFTGSVRVDLLFAAAAPSRMSSGSVTFEPGARSAWHSHPMGQILIVTAGVGRVQREGGPIEEIRPGDVVWIAPGVKHWHGAAPTTGMTHTALQEHVDGQAANWMEQVTDAQYAGAPSR